MKIRIKQLRQAGDTIVEVLIAIAVVSSTLAGSYTLSQRSVSTLNDSQEHNKASTLLKAQIELVRGMASSAADSSSGVFSNSPPFFCVDSSTPSPTRHDLPNIPASIPSIDSDNFAHNYSGACSNVNGIYNLADTYDASEKVFRFYVRWEATNGDRNQITYLYRVNPHITFVPFPAAPPVCSSPNQIAMTLDRSDSMWDNNISGVRRLVKLQQVATTFVNSVNIGTGNIAGIVSFSDTAAIIQPMTSSIPDLESAISNIGHDHGTLYLPALAKTANLWEVSGQDRVLVFISDGIAAHETNAEVWAITDAMKDSGITIYTIGIGSDADFTILRGMATAPSYFVNAHSSAQLENAMEAIAANVSCA